MAEKIPSAGPRDLPLTDPGFAISLAGGASVLLGSLVAATYALMKRSFFWTLGKPGQVLLLLVEGYYSFDLVIALATVGATSGILVLALAILTRLHPDRRGSYGRLIIVLSIISSLGLALIASIIGVLGGALALRSRARTQMNAA
jgi:hypothetical protein